MTSRYPKILSDINKTIHLLDRRGHVIPKSRQLLEDRLFITFGPEETRTRAAKRAENKEYLRRSREQYARCVYLEILDECPSLCLPFILAVSPSGCRSFDAFEFIQYCNQQSPQLRTFALNNEARSFITSVSNKKHFKDNDDFKKLIATLFPSKSSVSVPRPLSAMETQQHFAYAAANPNAIHRIFGDQISDAVEKAPARLLEKATRLHPTTECVRATIPHGQLRDCVLVLSIGQADGLVETLFPAVVLPLDEEVPDEQVRDGGYFTLKGASLLAIESIFSQRICEAIEASELRAWEKAHFLSETTDCVIMQVHRQKPHRGSLMVRLGYVPSCPIVVELYREPAI